MAVKYSNGLLDVSTLDYGWEKTVDFQLCRGRAAIAYYTFYLCIIVAALEWTLY